VFSPFQSIFSRFDVVGQYLMRF